MHQTWKPCRYTTCLQGDNITPLINADRQSLACFYVHENIREACLQQLYCHLPADGMYLQSATQTYKAAK